MNRNLGDLTFPCFSLIVAIAVATLSCAAGGMALDHDIEFKGPDGEKLWKLEPEDGTVELEDEYSQDLFKFRFRGGAITFDDAAGRKIEVVPSSEATTDLMVRDRDTKELFYVLRSEPDGDYRLEDAKATVVYKLKRRDYGFKVIDRGARELKVREKPGKVSIREPSGTTILSTRDRISTLAASCFSFHELPIEMQAGLSLGVLQWNLNTSEVN